jgi:hypothetical protein
MWERSVATPGVLTTDSCQNGSRRVEDTRVYTIVEGELIDKLAVLAQQAEGL